MSGILLIATFVFLFFFGLKMTGDLDRFLDSNCFRPQDDSTENTIQNKDLNGQDLAGFTTGTTPRAS